ncbi:hypothetical protein WJX72_008712 [[Myrmecia] bisecta]|uniref:DUF4211 domain-containing protein n=1 Tax=[Myrmecia] bisecta TaxID=41462 RepID=A0AAW1PYF4_9CHLO
MSSHRPSRRNRKRRSSGSGNTSSNGLSCSRRSRSKFVEGGGNRSGDDVTDEEGSDFIVSDDEVEYEEEDGAGSQSDSSKQGQSASEAEDADEASEDEDRPAPQQAKRAPQQAKQAARRKQPSRHQPEQQQPAAAAQEEEDSDTQQQAKRPARGRRASQIVESSDEEEADLDQLASGTEPGNAAAQRKRRRLVQAVDTVPVAAHLEERPDVVVLGGDADGEEAVAQTAQAGTSAGSSRRRHTVLSESEEEEGAGRPENSQDNSDEEQPAPWRRRRVVEEAADGDEERPAATPSRPRRRAAAKETPLSARERIRRATQAAFEEDGRASQDEAESDGERSGSGGEEGAAEAGAPEDNDEDLAGFIVEDDEGAPELPEELRPIPNDPRALFDIYVESLLDNCLGLGWRYGSEDTQRRYERAEQRIAGRLWECRSQLQGLGWVSAAEKGQIFADFKRLPGMWNAWQQATSKADEDEHHAEGPEYEDKCMVCGRHCGRHRKLEVFGREHGRPGAWRESCVFRVGRACAASMVLYHALSHYPTRLMARLKREAKTVLQYHKEASKEEVVDDIMNNTSLMNWLWRNYTALEQVAVQFQMKHARQDRAPFAKRVTKIVTDLHEDPEAEESDPQFSRRARRTPRTGRASEEGRWAFTTACRSRQSVGQPGQP